MKVRVALACLVGAGTFLAASVPTSTWVGTYHTKQTQLVSNAMSDNFLTVNRMSGGGFRFNFEAVSGGCIGEVDFRTAKLPTGSDLMLSTEDDAGGVCVMRLHKDGPNIIAAEDNCDAFRGMQCTFSGTYKPERVR